MVKQLFAALLLFSLSYGQNTTQTTNKAVFDCSAEELSFIASRLRLIERTAQDFELMNEKSNFVLTVHSHCTPIVAEDASFYYPPEKAKLLENLQKQLQKLISQYHVEVRACEIALEAFDIQKDDLIKGVQTTPNSVVDVIQLQNRGYALFPLIR